MLLEAPILYHFLESVPSTNTWVRSNYHSFDLNRLHVLYTSEQTQGRGTHGKAWLSPKDLNIYASLFFSLPKDVLHHTLTQVLSLSIADTLSTQGFIPAIKWPNDLMLDHKKICGILCELIAIGEESLVILGFGLNVNMSQDLCNTIDQPTSSLFATSQTLFSTSTLLESILLRFQTDLLLYLKEQFTPFTERYNHYMIYKNYPVVFNNTILGTSQSVNHLGELEVLSPSGMLTPYSYGSIKL